MSNEDHLFGREPDAATTRFDERNLCELRNKLLPSQKVLLDPGDLPSAFGQTAYEVRKYLIGTLVKDRLVLELTNANYE